MNVYVMMAHFVGRILHIRPSEILDTWAVPELVVAFGEYANEKSREVYEQWKSYDRKTRASIPMPKEYNVRFFGVEQLEDEA